MPNPSETPQFAALTPQDYLTLRPEQLKMGDMSTIPSLFGKGFARVAKINDTQALVIDVTGAAPKTEIISQAEWHLRIATGLSAGFSRRNRKHVTWDAIPEVKDVMRSTKTNVPSFTPVLSDAQVQTEIANPDTHLLKLRSTHFSRLRSRKVVKKGAGDDVPRALAFKVSEHDDRILLIEPQADLKTEKTSLIPITELIHQYAIPNPGRAHDTREIKPDEVPTIETALLSFSRERHGEWHNKRGIDI